MDYINLYQQTFEPFDLDVKFEFHAYKGQPDSKTGWEIKCPEVEFKSDTVLILHFPDFITNYQGKIQELKQVEEFYGDNCKQIVIAHWPSKLPQYYSGQLNFIEFPNHNYMFIHNLLRCHDQWKHILEQTKTIGWQCLNGRICEHRQQVANILKSWPNGILSLGNEMPLPKWHYQTYFGTDNHINLCRLDYVYGSCAVNIITETQYDAPPGIITEKTFSALITKQIPIIIGHAGAVRELADMGFDTFSDLVDTSYDNAPNENRAELALTLNRDLILGNIDLTPYQERLQRQHDLAMSYPEILKNQFINQAEKLVRVIFKKLI